MPFASGASHSHARAVTTQGRNAKDARKATHTRQKLGQLLAKEFRQRSELQPQKPVVVSLNYCSQNGGNLYRASYYNGNPNIGPRIIGNLDQSTRVVSDAGQHRGRLCCPEA